MAAPGLAFEWEEWLFRGARALWRRLRADPGAPRAEAVTFEANVRAWEVLAGLLAGEPVRLVAARGEGGLRVGDLLIPAILDLGGSSEDNHELLLVRICVGATQRRLALEAPRPSADPAARALASLAAGRAATVQLAAELDGYRALHDRVASRELATRPAGAPGWDQLRAAALDLDRPWLGLAAPPGPPGAPLRMWGELVPAAQLADDTAGGDTLAVRRVGSERKGRPVDEVERVHLDEEKARERVIQHVFEKVETLDEHRGQERRSDGEDELGDHAEALDELDLRQVIRGGEPAEATWRVETGLDAGVPDVTDVVPGETGIPYDEWDGRVGGYRRAWCTVYATPMGLGEPTWARGVLGRRRPLVDDLHRRLLVHRTRRTPERRQRDGDDLDMDAVVDDLADRRAGRGPSDRLDLRRVKRTRSLATTVLIDVSLSTDAWIDDQRVLDVAREAALVLGEVAARLGDPLRVLAFASHTRTRCRVWSVREPHEPWARGRARLGSLRPQGYTRIGPALRHALAGLYVTSADRRLLLLISDGKPTDFDRYEGRYGVADVRQALREGEARGVLTHALAVDARAGAHLPAMFGPGAWHVLPSPGRLAEALTTVYGRLTGR